MTCLQSMGLEFNSYFCQCIEPDEKYVCLARFWSMNENIRKAKKKNSEVCLIMTNAWQNFASKIVLQGHWHVTEARKVRAI